MTMPMTELVKPARLPLRPSRLACNPLPAMIRMTPSSRAQVAFKRENMGMSTTRKPNGLSLAGFYRPRAPGSASCELDGKAPAGKRMDRLILAAEQVFPEQL